MSLNYAQAIPKDRNGNVLEGFPPQFKANAVYSTNNATASSVITLNDNTTMIEICAVGAPVAVRWVPSTDTTASVITLTGTANFDYIVGKDSVRRFVSPLEKQGVSSVVGIGVQVGSYRRVAVMSNAAVSSIMVSEF